jgi:hypothetical protein
MFPNMLGINTSMWEGLEFNSYIYRVYAHTLGSKKYETNYNVKLENILSAYCTHEAHCLIE